MLQQFECEIKDDVRPLMETYLHRNEYLEVVGNEIGVLSHSKIRRALEGTE
jgi:hypothetical protein